jgi:hypothetical protein
MLAEEPTDRSKEAASLKLNVKASAKDDAETEARTEAARAKISIRLKRFMVMADYQLSRYSRTAFNVCGNIED